MSDDEAAFLRTIRENPDADLPRLVYADWLEERGHQVRAQFLRAHIELERLTEDSPHRRELAFWCRTQLDTQPHLLFEPPLQPKFARYGRGLIEAAEFWEPADGEIASAFHLAPLRRVWVYGLDRWLSQLKRVPVENCLHTLDLTGNRLTADALRYLGTAMRFPHLKELVLTGCDLDDEAARVLCERPPFRELERIHIGGNPLFDDGQRRLRDHFGKRLETWGHRDPEHLYSFHKDGDFTVGVTNESTQLLLWLAGPGLLVARFDFAGNLIATESHAGDDDEVDAIRDRLMETADFRPATIRVKRFGFEEGQGIGDFPTELMWGFEAPSGRDARQDAEDWEAWLQDGNFTWVLGDDADEWWLNGDGEVIST